MEKNIPTAEEYISSHWGDLEDWRASDIRMFASKMSREYAKLHVEQALKAASENAEAIEGWNTGYSGNAASVDKESILNAYPLSNIK